MNGYQNSGLDSAPTQSNWIGCSGIEVSFNIIPAQPNGYCNAYGGTVDAEGYYWLAGVGGWQIYRISPAGEVVFTLDVPVEKPTKPMFGGKDLDFLYLTSSGFGLTEGTEENQPDAGGVLAISGLGVSGIPQHRFNG